MIACPVCGLAQLKHMATCTKCGWELNSGLFLGRQTQQDFERALAKARLAWAARTGAQARGKSDIRRKANIHKDASNHPVTPQQPPLRRSYGSAWVIFILVMGGGEYWFYQNEMSAQETPLGPAIPSPRIEQKPAIKQNKPEIEQKQSAPESTDSQAPINKEIREKHVIYKHIDEKGRVAYSNYPIKGAIKLNLTSETIAPNFDDRAFTRNATQNEYVIYEYIDDNARVTYSSYPIDGAVRLNLSP